MSSRRSRFSATFALSCAVLASCSREPADAPAASSGPELTNRLTVTPEVIANLGITFAEASRGKVGNWLTLPGDLRVPETRRCSLRAPAAGRVSRILERWSAVEAGEVVAELESPQLRASQQALIVAQRRRRHAEEELASAASRLEEGRVVLRDTAALAEASRSRLDRLRSVARGGEAFATKELLEAQRSHAEATQAVLTASLQRDELLEALRDKELLRDRAALLVDEALSALALLTGRSTEELVELDDGVERWRALETIELRSPSAGTVVEITSARGETVEAGEPIAMVLDASELRFRGWIPEGDLRSLRPGARVRINLPGGLEPVESSLIGPMPVADGLTRRVLVEASVPNPTLGLPDGLSAMAAVLVSESEHEEVLLPADCVVADGLEMIVFRRDPKDPSVVIRTAVELGLRGGGMIEALSGVLAGDSVIQEGVHQLKHTGLGKAPPGGHFHADGTWHTEHE